MELFEYAILDHTHQIQLLCQQGVRLASRNASLYSITLYQIDGFYIEVFYHREARHITHLRPFSTTDLLDEYLDGIDLSALMLR